jgi:protein-S-isoprenylcysteine O-methyltransferase
MGWFWWSVGSQLLLANPICTAGFFYVSWRFFSRRIPYVLLSLILAGFFLLLAHGVFVPRYEEAKLLDFFPGEYEAYRKKTPTGIPFIK